MDQIIPLDCNNINARTKETGQESGGSQFLFLFLLIKLYLNCLQKVHNGYDQPFPKDEENALLGHIEDKLRPVRNDLIRLNVEGHRDIEAILANYRVDQDVDLKKLSVRSLLASCIEISEGITRGVPELLTRWGEGVTKVAQERSQLSFSNYDKHFLGVTRDVHSLYQIYSIIDSADAINKQRKVSLEEKRLVLQRVFHIIGEYIKSTEQSHNLSDNVGKYLEKEGMPLGYLSEFRNLLAHHVLPVIDLGDVQIKELFDKSLLHIRKVTQNQIVKIEKDFIISTINSEEVVLDNQPLVDKFRENANKNGINGLAKYIENLKKQPVYSNLKRGVRESVSKIDKTVQLMKSFGFTQDQETKSLVAQGEIASEISASVTRFIHESRLNMYNKVKDKIVAWNLVGNMGDFRTAHADVVKITEVIDYLRYGRDVLSDNVIDGLLKTKVLERITPLGSGRTSDSLKGKLKLYFDEKNFKRNGPIYNLPGDIEAGNLVKLLDRVKESGENKNKLIKFLESVSTYQNIASTYIPPDEYKTLVGSLIINDSENKKKLSSFSVDLEKVQSLINVLENNKQGDGELAVFFKTIKNKIQGVEIIKIVEYKELLNSLYPGSDDKEKLLSSSVESLQSEQLNTLVDSLRKVEQDVSKLTKFFISISSGIPEKPISNNKYSKLVKESNGNMKEFSEVRKQLLNSKSFVDLLTRNSESARKLTKFLESVSASKNIENNYVPPDEYKKLIDGLNIDTNSKEKLLLFSVEWERVKSSIDLLDPIKGSNDGKIKLINLLKSASPNQDTGDNYIPPDEYEKLIDSFSIDADSKEKLLLFSVEWKKKQCISLLKKNPTALKLIYDGIIVGESVDARVYRDFSHQYQGPNEDTSSIKRRADSLSRNVPLKIKELCSSRAKDQVEVLKSLSNSYAVEAQFINIYSLLEKAKIEVEGDSWVIRKLRNNLSHTEGNQLFREQLLNLMKVATNQLDPSKKITISNFNEAVSSAYSNLKSSEIKKVLGITGTGANSGPSKQNLNFCVGRRRARSIIVCLFSKEDVEKFSKGKIDGNNVDKVIIDSEKFLSYVKSSQDEGKNAQLIKFIGDKSIEGDYRYLVVSVVQDQGYERYIQNERIKDLYGDISQQGVDVSSIKSSKLRGRLVNVVGRIQLIRGIHGTIVTCVDGTATDCVLSVGGISWSFASHPIENIIVKTAPKVVTLAGEVAGKVIPGKVLGKQLQYVVGFFGQKFGGKIAKGVGGAVGGIFDIIDIGMSANNLVDCKNRENSDNPCGDKELRDNIASISFSGVSFISGVALAAASMPVAGVAVGFAIMVGNGIYSGVSNIIEYEEKYDTTDDENWSIFWRTLLFQDMEENVQHLALRSDIVNSQAKTAWKALSNSPVSVFAYAIGLGVDGYTPALLPEFGKILMNRIDANTINFSRAIPKPIENATMLCLPQSIGKVYEKDIRQSVPTAVHYCENTIVIADKRRIENGTTILYNLEIIDKGTIIGSSTFNNYFLIFTGSTTITGGANTVNKFIFLKDSGFFGSIKGGYNATNIIDLSKSINQNQDSVVDVKVNYDILSDGILLLKLVVNLNELIFDYIDRNADTFTFKYVYIGMENKQDNVVCTYSVEGTTANDRHNRHILIDGGGGLSKDKKDIVDNCKKVAVSPYTRVTGAENHYTFHIKSAGYLAKDLYSEIDIGGTGTVIFPETSLLDDCDEIAYSSGSNTLSLKIGLGQGNQYTLEIKNYINTNSHQPNFKLIDKNGSNVIPKIKKLETSFIKIDSFELYAEHSLDDFDAIENHYKKILRNNKGYKVLGVLTGKSSKLGCRIFGSLADDIINFDQKSMFARGSDGSDIYVIDSNTERSEVVIDNSSDDKKLDVLVIPEVPMRFSSQQCDLNLVYSNTNIQVRGYLLDNSYRHLMIMNSKGETFIPYVQSMLCDGSPLEKGELVPFFHATPTQNMFILPKDLQGNHVVIDSRHEDIERYRDNDDLLLVREGGETPFVIKIEDFYNERVRWEDINFLLWNNGNFSPYSDLYQEVDGVMNYQDKLKDDYEKCVKEYIIDFTQSVSITHNQDDTLTSVGEDTKRIGVMILKNVTPDRIKVSSSDHDLVFSDRVSNNVVNIKNWDNSESYRVSTLEFDLGLEPIKIIKLEGFRLSSIAQIQNLIDEGSVICQKRDELEMNKILLIAAHDGDFSKVIALLDRCANINARHRDGLTPLHYGATNGNLKVVKYMVGKGADFNAQSDYLHTPLHLAAIYGHLEVVKYLKERGADFNLKNLYEQSPLHSAASNGKLEVVKYLVEGGANINDKDKGGRTPLDLAIRKGHKDIVKLLKLRN